MGAGPSRDGGLTHARLLEATKTTRGIIDILLEYLIRELNIRDFYLLSSPSECKKYVLFLASKLASKFIEFQITPTRDKSGTIAFRSVKDLTEPGAVEQKQRQSLCLTLAYFYVRIFQVYGALAVTLLDDAAVGDATGTMQFMEESGRLRVPGEIPYLATGTTGRFIKGGALPRDLGSFEIFRPYINDIGLGRGYPFKSAVLQMNLIPDTNIGQLNKRTGKIYVRTKGDKYFEIEIEAESKVFGGVKLIFKRIRMDSLVQDLKDLRINNEKFGKTEYEFMRTVGGNDWKTEGGQTVLIVIEKVANDLLEWVKTKMRIGFQNSDFSISSARIGQKPGRYLFEEKESVDGALKIAPLVNALTTRRPYGHCIARALQLLQNMPLGGNGAIESSICRQNFLENRHSIPDGRLGKSVGIGALAALFYDTVDMSTPKLVMSQPSLKAYTDFMRQMSSIFAGKGASAGQTVDSITTDARDNEICGKSTGKAVFVQSANAQRVYSIVQNMFAIQLEHAAACAKILAKLFTIERKASGEYVFHISPVIFKNGIGEVNRISEEARQLLVGYYSRCESEYLNGMTVIGKGMASA
jgi:hypothetical protein